MYEKKAKGALLLSHVDSEGRAKMVDVSGKSDTVRTAVARARCDLKHGILDMNFEHFTSHIQRGKLRKTLETA